MSIQKKNISLIDSNHLVNYILMVGGAMSHLKIQKVLFYIQAYHLAYFDKPIIEDEFQAWVHGPVSRKIYDSAKDISILHTELQFTLEDDEQSPIDIINNSLTVSQVELVNDVIDELKGLSGLQLENMTHSEEPWLHARRGYESGERCAVVIPNELITDYYKKQIYG
ncbi:SocA family protein [Polaribacter litorisediminis]|uniref:Panacea domain-containing protein n=1 Tax=Polaribacter litorisediminis TaxID=1908341 RepID=UPI001CC14652|nr:Panacea domain-containing protein [Polaribacter litorisediminis]UAM97948.1 SocA family protein [Polaribacter litorisediminis]